MSKQTVHMTRSGASMLRQVATDLWREPAAAPQQPSPAGALPPFDAMWRMADETVDWTDALVLDKPRDGAVGAELWTFFRKHAQAVLAGDTAAYETVLKQANPLADLSTFCPSIDVTVVSADRLDVRMECLALKPDLLPLYTERMALRIARDLFALLPVTEAEVVCELKGKECLRVLIPREALRGVSFSVVNPRRLMDECGAVMSAAEETGETFVSAANE